MLMTPLYKLVQSLSLEVRWYLIAASIGGDVSKEHARVEKQVAQDMLRSDTSHPII